MQTFHEKQNEIIGFFVLVMLLTSTCPSFAQGLYLRCGDMGELLVDLAKGTVNNLPAIITPSSVDWQDMGTNPENGISIHAQFHLDRGTKLLTQNWKFVLPDGSTKPGAPLTSTCISIYSGPTD